VKGRAIQNGPGMSGDPDQAFFRRLVAGDGRVHMEDRPFVSRPACTAFAVADPVMERALRTHMPPERRLLELAADLLVDAAAGLPAIDRSEGPPKSFGAGPALPQADIEERPAWTFAGRRRCERGRFGLAALLRPAVDDTAADRTARFALAEFGRKAGLKAGGERDRLLLNLARVLGLGRHRLRLGRRRRPG